MGKRERERERGGSEEGRGRGRGIDNKERAKIPAEIPIDLEMFDCCCLQRDADESD